MKTAFLILGAQRSGTSVTSHVLSRLGIDFGDPDHFLQADHNPIFFELKWVNSCNDQLLHQLGYTYTDFFLPVEEDFARVDLQAIEQAIHNQITDEWGDKPAIAMKDPRFSLTFPVWQKILLSQGYQLKGVIGFRSPYNFLQSNQKLFHNWKHWDTERHIRFWLQLNLAATYFTRTIPVYYMNYDQLTLDPVGEVEALASFFQLDRGLVEYAALAVQQAHCHHHTFKETGYPLADQWYKRLCSKQVSPNDYLEFRNSVVLPRSISTC